MVRGKICVPGAYFVTKLIFDWLWPRNRPIFTFHTFRVHNAQAATNLKDTQNTQKQSRTGCVDLFAARVIMYSVSNIY